MNIAIINASNSIIPPPNGADITTIEGLKASIHLFEPKHFAMPFLAHALGTFIGAFLAIRIAITNKMKIALAIGGFFLLGGVSMVFTIPSPTWFIAADLILAYLPFAYLGYKLETSFTEN